MPNAKCWTANGHLASGIQHSAIRYYGLAPASSFFTASSVRSSPSAPQITVSLGTLSRRCSPFSIESCSQHRKHLFLEFALQLLLELVQIRLRVLLEALELARLPIDFLFELARACSFMTLPPVCSFCWFACSALVFSALSACFFCVSACTLALAALPSTDN